MFYKFIIFDLDQTLYPKKSGLLPAIDRRIDEFMQIKLNLSLECITQMRHDYWKKYGTTIEGLIGHQGIDPDEYMDFAYNIPIGNYIAPNPLLAEVLQEINLRRIVFSNSPRDYVNKVLEVLGISDLFQAVYDIKFCDYHGKPHLSSYTRVLEDLGAVGSECLFVDDVLVNINGAKRLGMTPIWLNSERITETEWVITDILEVGKIIPEIIKQERSA